MIEYEIHNKFIEFTTEWIKKQLVIQYVVKEKYLIPGMHRLVKVRSDIKFSHKVKVLVATFDDDVALLSFILTHT